MLHANYCSPRCVSPRRRAWRHGESAGVNIDIDVAPPPARVEVVPGPRQGWVWAPGYWQWGGHQHVWVGGHWIRERRGYHWVPDAWVGNGPHYHYVRGHWEH